MADEIDRAQEREHNDRELALAAQRERIAASFAPRDPKASTDCIDCEQPIEKQRLLVVRSTSRCAACARIYEDAIRRTGRWI